MSYTDANARETLAADVLDRVRKAGADAADVILVRSVSLAQVQRLRRRELVERAESLDLGLRVLVGRRQAIVSTTDLSPRAVAECVERAVTMARAVPEDPFAGLAEPAQLCTDIPDVDSCDPHEPSAEDLAQAISRAEDAALAVPGITNSDGASASWSLSNVTLAASNGFVGSFDQSGHSLSMVAVAGEGTGMERDHDSTSAVYRADLRDPEEVGRMAAERTVRRLNPQKGATRSVPVVFDRRVSRSFVQTLAGATSGPSIARGTSFLVNHLGKALFAEGVRIIDRPHLPRGLRSRPFDAEGLPTTERAIIDDGVLTGWFLDLGSARQLDMDPTGNASRGPGSPPSPSPSNLFMEAGTISVDAMIGEIEDGFFVTEMMGQGVNAVTGDYSRGAAGYWIENGKLAYPVSEMTIAGNLLDMFARLTPADDLILRHGIDAPTVRIDGMTVAGR